MPERKSGEPLSSFISRFVSNKRDKKKWPNIKQRLAVGYAEAKRATRNRNA